MRRSVLWTRRILVVCAAAGSILVSSAGSAVACSCAGHTLGLQNSIRESGAAAFVGEVLRVQQDGGQTHYRFAVDEPVAGDIGPELEAMSFAQASMCGVRLRVGERVGFVLGRAKGRWIVSSCGRVGPDELLSAGSWRGWATSFHALPWYGAGVVGSAAFGVLALVRRRRRPASR